MAWRKPAENCSNYLKKGSLGEYGRIQVRSYESQESRRWVTEVVADEVQLKEVIIK